MNTSTKNSNKTKNTKNSKNSKKTQPNNPKPISKEEKIDYIYEVYRHFPHAIIDSIVASIKKSKHDMDIFILWYLFSADILNNKTYREIENNFQRKYHRPFNNFS